MGNCNLSNERRKKHMAKIIRRRRIVTLCGSILIILVLGIVISKVFFHNKDIKLSAKGSEETSTATSSTSSTSSILTNKENLTTTSKGQGLYLKLEDDPNAEDALEVFANLDGLLKGTKKYPVRTDGKKVVYLTFDDGPSTTNTPQVLDVLDKYNIKATFFILGKSLEEGETAENILKRIASDGHAIGNHSYSHDYNYLYPGRTINPDNFMADINKCTERIKKVLGDDFDTRVIRFPGGYWSWEGRTGIRPILDEKGYAIIDWNTLNEDAQGAKKDANGLVECLKKNTDALGPDADSVVVLMHDTYGKEETVKSLPGIIEYFKDKGFEFKTIK
ncbi:MAG: polysaccharide deacetylase [Clostridium sp.]|nr:polysaccharide deacetylase [Clostridium sp.]MCI7444225.1 polysaccharide deacetylase [Clostridium sp.]